jgi:hypothetical protein
MSVSLSGHRNASGACKLPRPWQKATAGKEYPEGMLILDSPSRDFSMVPNYLPN